MLTMHIPSLSISLPFSCTLQTSTTGIRTLVSLPCRADSGHCTTTSTPLSRVQTPPSSRGHTNTPTTANDNRPQTTQQPRANSTSKQATCCGDGTASNPSTPNSNIGASGAAIMPPPTAVVALARITKAKEKNNTAPPSRCRVLVGESPLKKGRGGLVEIHWPAWGQKAKLLQYLSPLLLRIIVLSEKCIICLPTMYRAHTSGQHI